MKRRRFKDNIILKESTINLYKELTGKKKHRCKYSIKRIHKYNWDLVTVDKVDNMKIEVREAENGHKIPHFHVTLKSKQIDAVYKIDPIEFYIGEIDSKSNKSIKKWAEINRDVLVDMWNEFHGHRIRVN